MNELVSFSTCFKGRKKERRKKGRKDSSERTNNSGLSPSQQLWLSHKILVQFCFTLCGVQCNEATCINCA